MTHPALRPGKHRVVVGEHHRADAADRRGARDQAIGRARDDQLLLREPRALRRDDEPAVLREAAGIDEIVDVLARGSLVGLASLRDRIGARRIQGRRDPRL